MSRIERTDAGFVVDADLLAAAFRLPAASVRALMRDGQITSRCEAGVGEDAGRWRLSFYHGGRVCRLTIDADGTLLGRATFPAPARARETAGRTDEEPDDEQIPGR